MADDWGGGGGGWWGTATAGLGALGDIFAFTQNAKARNQQENIYDILSNPAKLAAYIQSLYQPLTAGAQTAVNRDLNSNWAVNTGGATGGALNQFIADAFAKIEANRYQDTSQNAIAALSRAGGYIPQNTPGGMFGNALKSLQVLKQLQSLKGPQDPAAISPGIAPVPGGGGYAGGSEAFRDRGVFAPPETVGSMSGAIGLGGE